MSAEEDRLETLLLGQETALKDAADIVRGNEKGIKPLLFVLDLVSRWEVKRQSVCASARLREKHSLKKLVSLKDKLITFLSTNPDDRDRGRVLRGMCEDIEHDLVRKHKDTRTILLEEASKSCNKMRQLRREWLPVLERNASVNMKGIRLLREVGACSCRALLYHFLDASSQLQLPKQKLRMLISEFDRDCVSSAVCQLMQLGHITFPLKIHYLTDIEDKFRRLQRCRIDRSNEVFKPYNVNFKTPKDFLKIPLQYLNSGKFEYVLFLHKDSEYWDMDIVTDYFTEVQRMSARRKDQALCPLEMFAEDKHFQRRLIEATLLRPEGLTPFAMREAMWTCLKECTQFKSSLAVSVMKMLNATRVLDISAGWGDRLIGAMAAGVDRYVACDPNHSLKEGHDRIIETFQSFSKTHATIVYDGFERARLPPLPKDENGSPQRYNLVFTSPPFFDFEIYTKIQGQSMDTFQRFNDWLLRFLFVSLSRAWALLERGGFMAIHITDIPASDVYVCEKMVLFMMWRLPNSMYTGCIGSSGHVRKPRPIWVVQKIGSQGGSETLQKKRKVERERGEQAGLYMKEFFPDVAKRVEEEWGGHLGVWHEMQAFEKERRQTKNSTPEKAMMNETGRKRKRK